MTAKPKKQPAVEQYPTAQQYRSGIKVAWNYYAEKADAEKCSELAKRRAAHYREQGYDFGYCSPGSIELQGDKGFYPGLYEVCIP
jgi:hypothetical protein